MLSTSCHRNSGVCRSNTSGCSEVVRAVGCLLRPLVKGTKVLGTKLLHSTTNLNYRVCAGTSSKLKSH